jgi:hypothetical protein
VFPKTPGTFNLNPAKRVFNVYDLMLQKPEGLCMVIATIQIVWKMWKLK